LSSCTWWGSACWSSSSPRGTWPWARRFSAWVWCITAYVFGLRHAFDADHIAAIDNTTRKLMADGGRPRSVGFWFAMGHSGMVFVLTALMALGTRAAATLAGDGSAVHAVLSTAGTLASGASCSSSGC